MNTEKNNAVTLPVIDERYLDEQIKEIRDRQQRVEFAGREPVDWMSVAVVALILSVICVTAFSPEIAAFLYKISN